MSEAWAVNPKLQSDMQKSAFLGEYVQIAKTIGVHNTTEHIIPCLINCFNCDDVIHPDTYDGYATALFANMDKLIQYLSRDCKPKQQQRRNSDGASS